MIKSNMLSPYLIQDAGGLRYHLRALKRSNRLWSPFRSSISQWVSEWVAKHSLKRILWIGPSGGYCLDTAVLPTQLWVMEPDPIARFVLRRKLVSKSNLDKKFNFVPCAFDLVLDQTEVQAQERWSVFLKNFSKPLSEPDTGVLFSNVLGQLFLYEKENQSFGFSGTAFLKRQLPLFLASCAHWASFHDRLSGELEPSGPLGALWKEPLSDADLLNVFYSEYLKRGLKSPDQKPFELCDHSTSGFFAASERIRYFSWQLSKTQYHLIETQEGGAIEYPKHA